MIASKGNLDHKFAKRKKKSLPTSEAKMATWGSEAKGGEGEVKQLAAVSFPLRQRFSFTFLFVLTRRLFGSERI